MPEETLSVVITKRNLRHKASSGTVNTSKANETSGGVVGKYESTAGITSSRARGHKSRLSATNRIPRKLNWMREDYPAAARPGAKRFCFGGREKDETETRDESVATCTCINKTADGGP